MSLLLKPYFDALDKIGASPMRELYAIGNNLNQIANRAHVTGNIDAEFYKRNYAEFCQVTLKIMEAVYEHRKLE